MQWMASDGARNTSRWIPSWWLLVIHTVVYLSLVGSSGCRRQDSFFSSGDRPPSTASTPGAATQPAPPVAPRANTDDPASALDLSFARQLSEPVPPEFTLYEEVWYAYYLDRAKVGHGVRKIYQQLGADGQPSLVRIELEQQLSMLRAGQPIQQYLLLQSLEEPDGRVVALRSLLRDAQSQTEMRAEPAGTSLHVVFKTADSSSVQTMPWDDTIRGFFADEQLLRSSPPRLGEQRSAKMFMPVLNLIGELQLTVGHWETVETRFGTQQLLRVDSLFRHPQLQSASVLWCDQEGRVSKCSMIDGKLIALRAAKELALAANDQVDLYRLFQVPVINPIPDPHRRRLAVYRATVRGHGNPERLFVNDHSQHVRLLDPYQVEITVVRVTATEPLQLDTTASPTAEDLTSNSLLQSDHPLIRELAEQVAPASADAETWVTECEAFVHRYIERKSLDEAFGSAVDVAQSRSGDCTEHAVLMAALCRARGVPARVAAGLVAHGDAYAFHMWTEVWVNNRWVPMDATLAQGGIGAGHIKLSVSNLSGVSPFSVIGPVLELMSGLQLEVVRYE